MSDDNIWSDEWGEQGPDWSGGGGRGKLLPRGEGLGATVYELGPGNFVPYHFHHRWEELLIVLRGNPTLRTPDGERRLEEGDAVLLPVTAARAALPGQRPGGGITTFGGAPAARPGF